MQKVTGLNHITLAVKDLDRSVTFYRDVLGLDLRKVWPGGAYLEAGSFWICLSPDPAVRDIPHPDYTHIAFSVEEEAFASFCEQLNEFGVEIWKENKSEGASFYFLDPDHHKMELHVGDLQSRLAGMED
ncbi:fosfomycin resistance glutathione transferase [Kiloniella majae]|uniref:fosfomycin resistance glutathione transferase n=1 Tax=Kiloniella majae TaxID=1938558 RepID=UPI000A2794E4|nr:fosfomycin resistance glutathione transferase [Kiloniella majae]